MAFRVSWTQQPRSSLGIYPQCQQPLRLASRLLAEWVQTSHSGFRHPICTAWKERKGWLFHRLSQESQVASFPEFPELSPCFLLVAIESYVHSLPNLCGRETPHAHWLPGPVTMMRAGGWIEQMVPQRQVDTQAVREKGQCHH